MRDSTKPLKAGPAPRDGGSPIGEGQRGLAGSRLKMAYSGTTIGRSGSYLTKPVGLRPAEGAKNMTNIEPSCAAHTGNELPVSPVVKAPEAAKTRGHRHIGHREPGVCKQVFCQKQSMSLQIPHGRNAIFGEENPAQMPVRDP